MNRNSCNSKRGCRKLVVQPIPLGVTFSKAQSSKLERLFYHVSVKRDVGALSFESFELWNSIRKCHPKWDWLYFDVRNWYVVGCWCWDDSMWVRSTWLWVVGFRWIRVRGTEVIRCKLVVCREFVVFRWKKLVCLWLLVFRWLYVGTQLMTVGSWDLDEDELVKKKLACRELVLFKWKE